MHYKEVKAILSPQNGMNIYRGCTMGCLYCDARSKCYRVTHAFEDVEIKQKADDMLEHALKRKRTKSMISTGTMNDPYIELECELELFRRCLNQIERFEFGLVLKTRSELILRDLDILSSIARKTKCVVIIPLSAADDKLSKKLEPGAAITSKRVEILKTLRDKGITTIVSIEPIIPFINDDTENIKTILDYCVDAGVYGIMCEETGILLRDGSKEYFMSALHRKFPGIEEIYEDKFYDAGEVLSEHSSELTGLINKTCDEHGIVRDREELKRFMREYKNKTNGVQLDMMEMLMGNAF